MSTLAKVLGNMGPRHQLTACGKTYTLRRVDWDMKLDLQMILLQKKLDDLSKFRGVLSQAKYDEKADRIVADYEEGLFALEAPEGQRYYAQGKESDGKTLTEGMLRMSCLVFGCYHREPDTKDGRIVCHEAEMVNILAEKGTEAAALLNLTVRESLLRAPPKSDPEAEGVDPNAERAG